VRVTDFAMAGDGGDRGADLRALGTVLRDMLAGSAVPDRRLDAIARKAMAGQFSSARELRNASATVARRAPARIAVVAILTALLAAGIAAVALRPAPGVWSELGGSATGGGISRTANRAQPPSLRIDPQGRPVVSWLDGPLPSLEIHVRRWEEGRWNELARTASGAPIRCAALWSKGVSLALDSLGRPCISWAQALGAYTSVYVLRWDGREWAGLGGSATAWGVSHAGYDAPQPSLALDAWGHPAVAWHDSSGPRRSIHFKQWDGRAWVEPGGSATGGGVSGGEDDAFCAALALDTAGRPTVAWHEKRGGRQAILLRRWNGAAWVELDGSASRGLSRTAGKSRQAALALDASSDPVVAWCDQSGGKWNIYVRRWVSR
jgi:hypothetical protein